jgi:lipoprotein-releasing system permease protein
VSQKQWIPWMALRFWRSKKSFSIINIISGISFWGIAVGTAALIIVLSAFNGLEGMISTMFNNFHSELRIEPVSGKYFANKDIDLNKVASLSGIDNASLVVEDICMVRYGDRQQVVYIKGIEPGKGYEQKFTPLMLNGTSNLGNDSVPRALIGAGIYYSLGVNINDFTTPLTFYSPKRTSSASADISTSFISKNAIAGGMFSVQQDFDDKYIVVPASLARDLLEYNGISTAMEINISNKKMISGIEDNLQKMVGDRFVVKNRIEQEEAMYKIMKSEKLIVFLILALILLITSFTIISTLTLEILGKQKDLSTLFALGAGVQKIRRVIVSHGFIICLAGMLIGFIISIAVLLAQQTFGLVHFSGGDTFISDVYPVKMIWSDFVYVFFTVLVIAALISRIPVRRIHTGWFSFRY